MKLVLQEVILLSILVIQHDAWWGVAVLCVAPGQQAGTAEQHGSRTASAAQLRTASAHQASGPAASHAASTTQNNERKSPSPVSFRAGFAYEQQQTPLHKAHLHLGYQQQHQQHKHAEQLDSSPPRGVLKHADSSSLQEQQQRIQAGHSAQQVQ
jgi:hypothetical protein